MLGSLSSSKKGWHIASMAERRCVGVYSRSAEIKSMASWGARRKTWEEPSAPQSGVVSSVDIPY